MDNKSNVFNTIQVKPPSSSLFDLAHTRTQSQRIGYIYPSMAVEMLPGSVASYEINTLARLAPTLAPVMGNINVYSHTFFVPFRLLWRNFKWHITGGNYPTDTPNPPQFSVEPGPVTPAHLAPRSKSLSDYLGLPVLQNGFIQTPVTTFYHQAYQRIWADYYRDQDLQPITDEEEALGYYYAEFDGVTTDDWYLQLHTIRRRAYRHDYFTSARPWAQKGSPVSMPVTFDDAEVYSSQFEKGTETWGLFGSNLATYPVGPIMQGDPLVSVLPGPTGETSLYGAHFPGHPVTYNPNGDLFASLKDITATSNINDLRTAYSLQRWLEKNARAGSRYVELLRAHFNVTAKDSRLQRPEYVGGSKTPLQISEVLQTAPATEESPTPQGTMAGHSIATSGSKRMKYKAHEHGILMTLTSVVPEMVYMNQGIDRKFTRFDRFDYAWPDFANTGEQAIKRVELFYDHVDPSINDQTFGYIPVYSEYRWHPSQVAGEMRESNLDYWHTGRKLTGSPTLSEEFITVYDEDYRKLFPVTLSTYDDVYISFYHDLRMRHPLPKYGTPLL